MQNAFIIGILKLSTGILILQSRSILINVQVSYRHMYTCISNYLKPPVCIYLIDTKYWNIENM